MPPPAAPGPRQSARVDSLSIDVVGESFTNLDGTERQVEVKRCRAGEPVHLRREVNRFDPNAVAVHSVRDVQIGYIPKERAKTIGAALDEGRVVSAEIEEIDGGGKGYSVGAVLTVKTKRRG